MGKQLDLVSAIPVADEIERRTGKSLSKSPVPQFNPAVIRTLAGEKIGESLRRMPAQKPGNSKQDYSTPDDLMAAIKTKFGVNVFTYDLAASKDNAKGAMYFTEAQDSLKQNWVKLEGDCWLNPPFARISPWAAKCAGVALHFERSVPLRRVFFLIPAAPGSNWWRDFVHEKARVVFLNGRPSFDGKGGFPKDLAICIYGEKPSYEVWSWRKQQVTPTGKHSK